MTKSGLPNLGLPLDSIASGFMGKKTHYGFKELITPEERAKRQNYLFQSQTLNSTQVLENPIIVSKLISETVNTHVHGLLLSNILGNAF